jgi:hypothetical protein
MTQPQLDTPPNEQDEELKAFLLVVHRSLKMIVCFIEKKYQIGDEAQDKRKRAA